ncbi:hypothetical protein ACHAL6_02145 [Proteiniclasticum sp. C24MP]|uniref:hypothetical protein n=1 Tax=Proteiniclasticum sp. C24MP TaxID=3374101 RepID=UPI0037552937
MSSLVLLEEKFWLLSEALAETEIDGKNVEDCISAIEKNDRRFEALKALQVRLSLTRSGETAVERKMESETLTILKKLSENTKKLQKRITEERNSSVKSMNDFSNLKKISKSYVKAEQGPVFVDKDFR